MYKAIFFSDLHLKDNESIGGLNKTGTSYRLKDKCRLLGQVLDEAINREINAVFILGDLYDNPHPSNLLRRTISRYFNLVLQKIPIYLLGGNHDTNDGITYNMMSESILNPNLIFAKNIELDTQEGILFKLLSWNQESVISEYVCKKPTILLGHFQIEGAKFENERLAKSFIKPSDLQKFLRVYSGHFHKRQPMYIGSLCRNDFGERDNPVGYLYLELEDGKIKTEQLHSIEDRQFYQFEKEVGSEEEIFNYIDSLDMENNVLKIKFKVSSDCIIHRRKIKDYAKSKNPFDVLIEYEREEGLIKESLEKDLDYSKTFNKFIQMKNLTKEQISVGTEIVEGVF